MSIFEKIIQGEIPCHKIWEDKAHLAFLDIRPVAEGHTLVIPKAKADPILAMEETAYLELWSAARKVGQILKTKIQCERICFAVVGFEVPHVHIHVIPARGIQDFPWPGGRATESSVLSALASKLRTL
jgi:histidine triad (HIT) family protein